MRNSVSQSNGKSLIQLGDWYLGLYVDEHGNLSVYIDNANGVVKSYDTDNQLAEDKYQWAETFYVESTRPMSKVRKTQADHRGNDNSVNITTGSSSPTRRSVRVEVRK
jgi:hypothetical protein